jgi:hypothetical protein
MISAERMKSVRMAPATRAFSKATGSTISSSSVAPCLAAPSFSITFSAPS